MSTSPDLDQFLRKYSLFVRKNAREDIRTTYPELKDVAAFKGLDKDEMWFVWLMRCVCSPYKDLTDEKKVEDCTALAFGHNPQKKAAREIGYRQLDFPRVIRTAFEQMEEFELSHRVKMLLAVEKALNRLMKNIHDDSIEPEKFAKVVKDSVASMHEISAFIEGGKFGVVDDESEEMSDLSDELANYHKLKVKA